MTSSPADASDFAVATLSPPTRQRRKVKALIPNVAELHTVKRITNPRCLFDTTGIIDVIVPADVVAPHDPHLQLVGCLFCPMQGGVNRFDCDPNANFLGVGRNQFGDGGQVGRLLTVLEQDVHLGAIRVEAVTIGVFLGQALSKSCLASSGSTVCAEMEA